MLGLLYFWLGISSETEHIEDSESNETWMEEEDAYFFLMKLGRGCQGFVNKI